jgi:CRISPR-associated protein Cas5d
MIDNEIVRVKVIGEFACFTRPDLKVERMTYPCMTPSAARGVLDSILWKPEFQWWIHRIIVLNPIKFISIKRNEIIEKQGENPIAIDELKSDGKPKYRTQRSSIVLKDVAYIIEASVYQKEFDPNNPPKKYTEMFKRRVKKGQCWRRPYLGTREFSCEFFISHGNDQFLPGIFPIGSMLFDIFYDDEGKPEPLFFFDVKIENGVLECPKEANEKMMLSSHLQPKNDDEFNTTLYQFNQNEDMEATL